MAHEDLEVIPRTGLIRRIGGLGISQEIISSSAACLRTLALFFFSGLVVTIPFRHRTVLFELPYPPVYRDYTDGLLFASDLFLLATLIAWSASLFVQPRKVQFGPAFLTIPILCLPVVGLFSTFASVAPSISLYNTIRLFLLTGLYFYILNEVRSIQVLAVPAAIQVFLQSSVAIIQVLRQASIGLDYLGELVLDPQASGVSVVFLEGARILRAYGLSDHPNILGGCLTLGLLLIMLVFPGPTNPWRLVYSSVFAMGSLALFLTFSRSAWLAFILGTGLILFFVPRIHDRQALHDRVVLLFATGLLLLPFLWHFAPLAGIRLNYQSSFSQVAQEEQAIGERALLIRSANQIFIEQPLRGVGLAAFPIALMQVHPTFPVDYQPAHFVLLEVAAETGIFGGLVYFLLLVAPWAALWFNQRRLASPRHVIGTSALLLAVTVIGFFDYYTWLLNPGRLWQWLIWGLWGAAYLASLTRDQT